MSCIYCFISDSFQHELKERTNHLSRFEERLSEYRKLFIQELNGLNDTEECNCPKIRGYENKGLKDWLCDLKKEVQKNQKDIDFFFLEIIKIYNLFLRKKTSNCISVFKKLLKSNGIDNHKDFKKEYENIVFFRGRKYLERITESEFFHIPFNERYKVRNCKFSFSGHPLLYLGSSILCVCKELCEENPSKIEFAAFLYNTKSNLAIYDITNELESYIKQYLAPFFTKKNENIPGFYDPDSPYNIVTLLQNLKKFILSQVLTLKKKEESDKQFVEEYVLPQLLTECLINMGFDGVYYPSTKLTHVKDNYPRSDFYRSNLALFPNYSSKDNYDMSLLNKFNIHLIDKLQLITYTDVFYKTASIQISDPVKLFEKCRLKSNLESLSQIDIDGKEYFKTDIGKIELLGYDKYL